MTYLSFTVNFLRNGALQRRFTVPVARQVLHGVYFNGAPYLPALDEVKSAMPKTLHKAIDRGLGFWTDKHSDVVSMDLYGASRVYYRQGKPLGTLIAQANWKATPCRLDGYQHGPLNACAVKISESRYRVASDCGVVSIHVSAALAESRIAQSRESNAFPVFMYS